MIDPRAPRAPARRDDPDERNPPARYRPRSRPTSTCRPTAPTRCCARRPFRAPSARCAARYPAYDSLFGVTRLQTRLWDQLARPINHNPAILLRTQDLPPVYEENSCIYLFTRQTLELRRNRLGERPFMFEIEPGRGLGYR